MSQLTRCDVDVFNREFDLKLPRSDLHLSFDVTKLAPMRCAYTVLYVFCLFLFHFVTIFFQNFCVYLYRQAVFPGNIEVIFSRILFSYVSVLRIVYCFRAFSFRASHPLLLAALRICFRFPCFTLFS